MVVLNMKYVEKVGYILHAEKKNTLYVITNVILMTSFCETDCNNVNPFYLSDMYCLLLYAILFQNEIDKHYKAHPSSIMTQWQRVRVFLKMFILCFLTLFLLP